jgi:ribosome-binding factor A
MNSKISRINAEIERQTSNVISTRLSDPRLSGALIGVTKVNTTADLKYSKIYLSVYNTENPAECVKVVQNAAGFIRNELKSLMDIRVMPELSFFLDNSAEYGMKIDKLLKEINND